MRLGRMDVWYEGFGPGGLLGKRFVGGTGSEDALVDRPVGGWGAVDPKTSRVEPSTDIMQV